MSTNDNQITKFDARKPNRRGILFASLVTAASSFWVWQNLYFTSTNEVASQIRNSDEIVISVCSGRQANPRVELIRFKNRNAIDELATKFQVTGFWVPWDQLTAGSLHIECLDGANSESITIRTWGAVIDGHWTAKIDNDFPDFIAEQAIENHWSIGDARENLLANWESLENQKTDRQ